MAEPADDLLLLLIRHEHALQRTSRSIAAKVVAELRRAEAEILRRMSGARSTEVAVLERVLGRIRVLQRAAFARAAGRMERELLRLGASELAWLDGALGRALGPLGLRWSIPEAFAVEQVVRLRPFQGQLLRSWMSRLEVDQAARVRQAVRTGLLLGESVDRIADRLALELGVSVGKARTLARTAANHVAAKTRESFFRDNPETFRGMVWVSVIDGRTTDFCLSRNNLRYTIELEPIGHGYEWDGGPGGAHFNCRSIAAPIVVGERAPSFPADRAMAARIGALRANHPELRSASGPRRARRDAA